MMGQRHFKTAMVEVHVKSLFTFSDDWTFINVFPYIIYKIAG